MAEAAEDDAIEGTDEALTPRVQMLIAERLKGRPRWLLEAA
jgi:hypothetical protein